MPTRQGTTSHHDNHSGGANDQYSPQPSYTCNTTQSHIPYDGVNYQS